MGGVSFVLSRLLDGFAALTFPYGKLKEHVIGAFNAQQHATGGNQELQIDEMSGYWLSGARVKGVRLFTASTEPGQPPQKNRD